MATTRFENTLYHYEKALGRELTQGEKTQLQNMRGSHTLSFSRIVSKLKAGKIVWHMGGK